MLCPPSYDAVVAMMGAWMAGCTVVPLGTLTILLFIHMR
jgi:acyl-CoA synthetase (AMP-forming)/AMP-acid ligase II